MNFLVISLPLAWDSINVEWLILMLIDVSRLSFTESKICFILLLIMYQNSLTNQHISIFTTKSHCESESFSVVSDSLWPCGLYSPWNSPGQNTGVGSLSLLQGIFLTQGSNPGLPPCRWILYQLSHKHSALGRPKHCLNEKIIFLELLLAPQNLWKKCFKVSCDRKLYFQ